MTRPIERPSRTLQVYVACREDGMPILETTQPTQTLCAEAILNTGRGDDGMEVWSATLTLSTPKNRKVAEVGRLEDDFRLVLCEHCGSEGRIYRTVSRHWRLDPQETDEGECPVCEGTGLEMIEVEPVGLEDIERIAPCADGYQYAKDVCMPEYRCANGCMYEIHCAVNLQESPADERGSHG